MVLFLYTKEPNYKYKHGGNSEEPKKIENNAVKFLKFINQKFEDYKANENEGKNINCQDLTMGTIDKKTFFRNQKLFADFFISKEAPRGMLLYSGLGTGKTATVILSSLHYPGKEIIYLTPTKGIYNNIYEEIMKFGEDEYHRPDNYNKVSDLEKEKIDKELRKKINKRYKIFTYNSSKIVQKLYQDQETKLDLEKAINLKYKEVPNNPLDNKLLIVDEAHNFMRKIIAEGSINGTEMLYLMMDAKNLKIIFMSGTPIASDVFELAVMFNILRGYMYNNNQKKGKKYTVFPSDYNKFYEMFVDLENNRMINTSIYAERIFGLVSYYHGVYDGNNNLFPEMRNHILYCPMSNYQYGIYVESRLKEIQIDRNSSKYKNKNISSNKQFKKPKNSGVSSYRSNTRQICNFVFPGTIERPKNLQNMDGAERKTIIEKTLSSLSKNDLTVGKDENKGLNRLSTKHVKLMEKINQSPGLILIYSQFVEIEGIGVTTKILENEGYEEFTESTFSKLEPKKRYAVYTAKNKTKHDNILRVFNSKENTHGQILKILFINVIGIESLNLKGVRQVHILDPYWFSSRISQIAGRARRVCSHFHLPKNERFTDVYLYIAVPKNRNQLKLDTQEDKTTDEYLYELSKSREILFQDNYEILKMAAFDCELNYEVNKNHMKHKCLGHGIVYGDSDAKLYTPDIDVHMAPGSNIGIPKEKNKKRALVPVPENEEEDENLYYDKQTGIVYKIDPETNTAFEYGFLGQNNKVIVNK